MYETAQVAANHMQSSVSCLQFSKGKDFTQKHFYPYNKFLQKFHTRMKLCAYWMGNKYSIPTPQLSPYIHLFDLLMDLVLHHDVWKRNYYSGLLHLH